MPVTRRFQLSGQWSGQLVQSFPYELQVLKLIRQILEPKGLWKDYPPPTPLTLDVWPLNFFSANKVEKNHIRPFPINEVSWNPTLPEP